jgi:hypothetical protein
MSTELSATSLASASSDPRFQPGAYITDGEDLYWVQRAIFRPTPTSLRANVLVVEDCRTNIVLELDLARIDDTCILVRQAPTA